jgi:type IV pilus assembly protein PilA
MFNSPRGRIMKRLQQGFTLIELMIVVAIVGILVAIALPAYQDYVVRSKMSEATAAIAACKTSVAEYTATKGSLPTTSDAAACSSSASQYVAAGGGWNGSAISYTSQNTNASGGECTLTLTPLGLSGGAIPTWTGSYSVCASKYVPSNFR